jgi:hypothetical protein
MKHLVWPSAVALTTAICALAPSVIAAQDIPLSKYLDAPSAKTTLPVNQESAMPRAIVRSLS